MPATEVKVCTILAHLLYDVVATTGGWTPCHKCVLPTSDQHMSFVRFLRQCVSSMQISTMKGCFVGAVINIDLVALALTTVNTYVYNTWHNVRIRN